MTTFLEAHKDFVLKIKVKYLEEENESLQTRRVRLPRIIKNETVSYEELVGIVISFVVPDGDASASSRLELKLTYEDVDDDKVVIGSAEELLDAIDQFSEQRVLRITAEVKRFAKAVQAPKKTLPLVAETTSSRASTTSASNSSDAAVQTGTASAGTPILQNVVESVVNIILNAAVAINSRGGQDGQPVYYSPDGIPAPTAEGQEPAPSTETLVEGAPNTEATSTEKAPVEDHAAIESSEETKVEVEKKPAIEERPFIHGRHTCDSCLTTPIVGKRYHAVNMSDYDLCEKCFGNYKGEEITFEDVELERDRHLQARWNRRRDRMNNKGRGGGNGCRRRFGPPGHHTRWGPARGPPCGPPHGFQPPFNGGPIGFRGPPPPGVPPPPPPPCPLPWYSLEAPRNTEQKEGDLEKAIRLSLQDSQKKKAPAAASDDGSASESKDSKAFAKPAKEEEETASVKSGTETKTGDVKAAPMPMKEIPEPVLVETVKDAEKEGEEEVPATAPEPSAPAEEVVMSWDQKEASIVSDPFEIHMPSDACDVSEIKSDESRHSSQSKQESNNEPSFSSDAAGNGDVADLLGSTLDKCAQAIDAMVSELSRESSADCTHSTDSSYVGVQDNLEEASAGKSDEDAEKEGATILEPAGSTQVQENDVRSESAKSEEDWQVVAEDQHGGGDEELARAAQMIGSALFNSDIRSSQEMVSTMSGSAAASDGFSFASSVPTSVPSLSNTVGPAQRERWASQLAQLHTLGIDDDARCVDILERLTAANIGCGNSDEVSVQEVVNELWKN